MHLPGWFTEMAYQAEDESPIYLFELSAAILTAPAVASRSDGTPRTCVLCIDNKAALAALIKGSSSSELGTALADLFRSVEARCPIVWWFEYAITKPNAADPPPRECNAPAGGTCGRDSGDAPVNFARISSSRSALPRGSLLPSN